MSCFVRLCGRYSNALFVYVHMFQKRVQKETLVVAFIHYIHCGLSDDGYIINCSTWHVGDKCDLLNYKWIKCVFIYLILCWCQWKYVVYLFPVLCDTLSHFLISWRMENSDWIICILMTQYKKDDSLQMYFFYLISHRYFSFAAILTNTCFMKASA